MSIAAKLHILLITTILGVGLYMFLLYKEVKVFERDIADLRIKVQSIITQLPPPTNSIEVVTDVPQSLPSTVGVVVDNNEDDDASVTSNEIKEILTNIQDIQEDEQPTVSIEETKENIVPIKQERDDITIIQNAKTPQSEIIEWSDEKIKSMKYDELRGILRRCGLNPKGGKAELIEHVLSIKVASQNAQ